MLLFARMHVHKITILLLVIVESGLLVKCQFPNIDRPIQYPEGCDDYQVTNEVWPRWYTIEGYSTAPQVSSLSECRSLCTQRTDCGGFHWVSHSSLPTSCAMYNMNDDIIADYLNQTWFYTGRANFTWYSKTCPYDLGSTDLTCDSYNDRVYHNTTLFKEGGPTYLLTIINSGIPNLTASQCHAWCTLYEDCKSVVFSISWYWPNGGGVDGNCYMYKVSLQDLLDAGLDEDIRNYDTTTPSTLHDRYCRDGKPYIPQSMMTTTTDQPNGRGNPGKSGRGCLYGDDKVGTLGGVVKRIKDLKPGDKVMSLSDSGEIIYDDIYLITHASPDEIVEFTSIKVDDKPGKLSLTDSHMIIVDGIEKTAAQVRPRDQVYQALDNMSGEMMMGAVTSVAHEYRRGIYNPLTLGGRMVVNGVLVSTYPHVYRPLTAPVMHRVLWGVRMLYQLVPHYGVIVNITATGGDMPVLVDWVVRIFDLIFTTN